MKPFYLIEQQVPEFIKAEYPAFILFLKAYYKWLNDEFLKNKIETIVDLDKTPEEFIQYFRKQLDIYNITANNDSRFLLRFIKELYRSKGSEQGFDLFFKILFNKSSSVVYPWDFVLKPSSANWVQNVSIFVAPQKGNINNLIGSNVTLYDAEGIRYRASITASRPKSLFNVRLTNRGSGYNPLSPPNVTFSAPENGITASGIVNVNTDGTLKNIIVTNPGTGYSTSPLVIIDNPPAVRARAFCKVLNGSVDPSSIIIFQAGFGYETAPDITFSPPPDGGETATGYTEILNGEVVKIVLTNPGSGYESSPPSITIDGSGKVEGIQAKALASANVVELFLNKRISAKSRLTRIESLDGRTSANILNSTVKAFIESSGFGFRIGQVFSVDSSSGTGSLIRVKSVDSKGGILAVDIITFGIGYQTDFNVLLTPSDEIDQALLGARLLLRLDREEDDEILLGDTITVPSRDDNTALKEKLYIVKHDYTTAANDDGSLFPPLYYVEPEPEYCDPNYFELVSENILPNKGYYVYDLTYVGQILGEFKTQQQFDPKQNYTIIRFKTGQQCIYPGYYENTYNILGEELYIQDSFYYQVYSYVTIIEEALENYKDILLKVLHPTGSNHFGTYELKNSITLDTAIDIEPEIINVSPNAYAYVFGLEASSNTGNLDFIINSNFTIDTIETSNISLGDITISISSINNIEQLNAINTSINNVTVNTNSVLEINQPNAINITVNNVTISANSILQINTLNNLNISINNVTTEISSINNIEQLNAVNTSINNVTVNTESIINTNTIDQMSIAVENVDVEIS